MVPEDLAAVRDLKVAVEGSERESQTISGVLFVGEQPRLPEDRRIGGRDDVALHECNGPDREVVRRHRKAAGGVEPRGGHGRRNFIGSEKIRLVADGIG